MKQIDHDPNEWHFDRHPKYGLMVFAFLAFMWGGYLISGPGIDWPHVSLGILTGGLITAYVMNMTGNRVPEWMKSPDRRRDTSGE